MDHDAVLWLVPLFFLAALAYSSVGHGGATTYLAIFALFGFARADIVPTVLALNLLVSGLAFLNYQRAGHFEPRLLLPFIIASIPAAYVGGATQLTPETFSLLLGFTLLAAALRFLLPRPIATLTAITPARLYGVGVPVGLLLGFMAGLLGIGGGIFLSPLLLVLGWADAKKTAALSAAFIFLNSAAGLLAQTGKVLPDWSLAGWLGAAVLLGGALGSYSGAFRLSSPVLLRVLALVLLMAGFKLIKGNWL
ncbi:MAG: sulfite exporter TauE/SafE family protein [Gammaproteobacteria bacterium]|nr:sulfite exporter TauE/SafE family protein [Gammaproteobacteria bacterium]